jgi:hypothetical protein
MSKRYKLIPAGAFKGKKITIAGTDRVDARREIANDFMTEVFELHPGEYAISDESDLGDFVHFEKSRVAELWSRIEGQYGITAADAGSERLVDIFDAIARRRLLQ